MAFSYILNIAGHNIAEFGELKIIQNTEGYGTEGVCTSEFTFSIPAEEYALHSIPASAVVSFKEDSGVSFCPDYYIATRQRRGGKVSFKCYDRMIYTDQIIDMAKMGLDAENRTTSQNVAVGIAEQCGFKGLYFAEKKEIYDVYITADKLEGKTCRELLETISRVWCGVFRTDKNNSLVFVAFGALYYLTSSAQYHTSISEGGEKGPIEQVYVTNGKDEYSAGKSSADFLSTLKIKTEYASQDLAEHLISRLENYTYSAWDCEKCIIDSNYGNIEAPALINFGDGSTRVANSIIKYPTPYGVFISCSSNEVVENEFNYLGVLSRKIETKIGDNEELGNKTMITRYQGIVHLGEKTTNENGVEVQNRYGYTPATASGIVEFEGAMVSRVTPTKASFSADGKEAVIQYDGKAYRYNLEYDSSGNVTSFEKSEVVE